MSVEDYVLNLVLVLLVVRQLRGRKLTTVGLLWPVGLVVAVGAVLWVLGVGARSAFAMVAEHGGGPAIGRFGAAHHIAATAWATALVAMSLAEVLGRTTVLAVRARRTTVARFV